MVSEISWICVISRVSRSDSRKSESRKIHSFSETLGQNRIVQYLINQSKKSETKSKQQGRLPGNNNNSNKTIHHARDNFTAKYHSTESKSPSMPPSFSFSFFESLSSTSIPSNSTYSPTPQSKSRWHGQKSEKRSRSMFSSIPFIFSFLFLQTSAITLQQGKNSQKKSHKQKLQKNNKKANKAEKHF